MEYDTAWGDELTVRQRAERLLRDMQSFMDGNHLPPDDPYRLRLEARAREKEGGK